MKDDKKDFEMVLILAAAAFLLAGIIESVEAETLVTYGVFDINTLNAVDGATVNLENASLNTISNTTESNGYADIHSDETDFNLTIVNPGYVLYEDIISVTTVENKLYYITPISSTAIVKMRIRDQTLSEHEICIYYQENGRLHGCFHQNDTIQLLINKNYTITPLTEKTDMFLTPTAVKNWIAYIAPLAFGAIFLAAIIWVIIYYTRKSLK